MSKIFIPYYNEAKAYIPEVSKQLGDGHITKSISLDAVENTPDKSIGDIVPTIDWADIIVVMIYPGLEEYVCINRIISHAERSGKQIIGIYIEKTSPDSLPDGLKNFGQGCVALGDLDSIYQMIDNPSEVIWQDSEGNPFEFEAMDRSTC